MYRDLSALLAAKELDLEVAEAKAAELRAQVDALSARVETLEKELADASAPTNRDAVLEGAVKRSDDLERDNRHLAEQLSALREREALSILKRESIASAFTRLGEVIERLFKR